MNDLSLNIIPKRETNKYTVDEKLLSISLLEASRRDMDGILTPEYHKMESLLNVPYSTLRNWWKDKDRILKQSEAIVNHIAEAVAVKISIELVHLINSISGTYDSMENRDKINLLNSYITKLRLLQGRSTSNIAVKHDYIPPIASPDAKLIKENSSNPVVARYLRDKK